VDDDVTRGPVLDMWDDSLVVFGGKFCDPGGGFIECWSVKIECHKASL
jgi:hypothetical protein